MIGGTDCDAASARGHPVARFPGLFVRNLTAHGMPQTFIQAEAAEIGDGGCARTANRRLLGNSNRSRMPYEA